VVDLAAYRTGYLLVDVMILCDIFGNEAPNAVSGRGATVEEERHVDSIPLRITKWIDVDQFLVVHIRRTFCDCGALRFGKFLRTPRNVAT
jgi:hypothetical protein